MNNITPKLCRMQPHSQGILSFRYEIGNFCCLIRYQKMSGTWNCLQYDLISFLIFCTLQMDVIVWHKFKRYTSNLYCKEYNLRMAYNILLKWHTISFLNLTSHLCIGFSFSYIDKKWSPWVCLESTWFPSLWFKSFPLLFIFAWLISNGSLIFLLWYCCSVDKVLEFIQWNCPWHSTILVIIFWNFTMF